MSSWTLLRHGETTFHLEDRYQGDDDESALTSRGIDQTLALASCLKPLQIVRAFTSPVRRAKETMELLVKATGETVVTIDERLREVSISQWRGRTKQEIREASPNAHLLWKCLPWAFYDDAGEKPLISLYARVRSFLECSLSKESGIETLLVGHDHVNRAIIASLLDLPIETHSLIPQSLSAISRVRQMAHGNGFSLATSNWEHEKGCAAALPSSNEPRILLIRHGVTDANVRRVYQGQEDRPLNERGREQASSLSTLLKNVTPKIIVSSGLARAKQTAELLPFPKSCPRQCDERLNEFFYGRWQGLSEGEVSLQFPSDVDKWRLLSSDRPIPDGEHLSSLFGRVASIYSECVDLAHRLGTVVIVAHDVVIRTILCLSLRIGLKNIWKFDMDNCGITELCFNSLGWSVLRRHNIVSGVYSYQHDNEYL